MEKQARGRVAAHALTAEGVWWTKYGAASMDFSAQERTHPSDTIFKNVVAPKAWDPEAMRRVPPARLKPAAQRRHPAPSKEALLPQGPPDWERKLQAHALTTRQGALRRLEMRQRRIDTWAGEAPIRQCPLSPQLSQATRREMSLSALSCSQVSRDVYRRNGYLLGRSHAPLRSKSLSLQSVLFAGEVMKTSQDKFKRPRKYEMGWKTMPEKRFVFDPKSFLPVPRGGWDMSDDSWPDLLPAGRRALEPLPFEKDEAVS
ncbi:unnamed protein product [Effrenium voratum]|nr:unnamed protein product [Effrenium voratum]